ncbi:hypothetical protein HPG69_018104 [Diceros bicornis minor]|uniref:Uncharacterized protein n=1 Tax=Diceros bicornis minor TaxID=77932 RepID=A0A7J7F814_DICBM|nr:hypothetical protein HPG69_018104 [Diceros bicornis minor]
MEDAGDYHCEVSNRVSFRERVEPKHQIASYVVDRQEITPGPVHSDQEKLYPNGSLLFQYITHEDTGYYILQIIKKNFRSEVGFGQLCIHYETMAPDSLSVSPLHYFSTDPVAQPSIQASNTTVTENKDTMGLTSLTNDTRISIQWRSGSSITRVYGSQRG